MARAAIRAMLGPMERIGKDYAIGVHGPVFVCIWEHATTDEGADDAIATAGHLAKTQPRVGSLVVVPEKSVLPDSDVRQKLSAIVDILGERNVGIAMVHEGTGFRAAAVRGVVTAMNILARRTIPHQTFADLPPAAVWLDERTGGVDRAGLLDYTRSLRARIPPR